MSSGRKLLVVVAGLALVTVLGWALLIGLAYALGGVLTVEIHDRADGLDLYLPVPMAALDLAVAFAGIEVGRHGIHHGGFAVAGVSRAGLDPGIDLGELRRWGPVAVELLRSLERLPDATLVEVVDGHDRVRVSKRGRDLIVEVDEPGTSVRVAIPTHGARRVAARLLGQPR